MDNSLFRVALVIMVALISQSLNRQIPNIIIKATTITTDCDNNELIRGDGQGEDGGSSTVRGDGNEKSYRILLLSRPGSTPTLSDLFLLQIGVAKSYDQRQRRHLVYLLLVEHAVARTIVSSLAAEKCVL